MKYKTDGSTLYLQFGRGDKNWKELVNDWKLFIESGNVINTVGREVGLPLSYDVYQPIPQMNSALAQSAIPQNLPKNPVKRTLYRMMGRKPVNSRDFDTVVIEFEPDARKEFPGYSETVTGYKAGIDASVENTLRELKALRH